MKKTIQKMKELNHELEEVTKELETTFPSTHFKIKCTSEVIIFTVDRSETATETYVAPEYIIKYPPGTDITLLKSIIDKY